MRVSFILVYERVIIVGQIALRAFLYNTRRACVGIPYMCVLAVGNICRSLVLNVFRINKIIGDIIRNGIPVGLQNANYIVIAQITARACALKLGYNQLVFYKYRL